MLLEGRAALVSGIGPGLGRAVALALAREGADVALAARRKEHLEPVAAAIQALGRRAVACPTDVARPEDCARIVSRAVEALGGLDVLVNSAAAFGRGEPLADGDPAGWHEAMNVSFFGALHLTHAAVASLRASGRGRVIMVGSMGTRDPQPGEGAYAASKAALLMATKTLARELGRDGIRVNAVNPGYIQGEPIQAAFRQRAEKNRSSAADEEAKIVVQTALGYIPGPEEIAGSVVFLASDLACPVTGHVLDCNAGMWM
jgi:NAD(P)-dependent dehydrogenase (short-subunit alcohol dehydrogenase family)